MALEVARVLVMLLRLNVSKKFDFLFYSPMKTSGFLPHAFFHLTAGEVTVRELRAQTVHIAFVNTDDI